MQSTPPCIPELYHIYYNCCYSPMAHLHLVRTTEALLRAAPPCRRAAQPQACQPLQALAYSCSHPPATASHPQSHMHVLHPLPQPNSHLAHEKLHTHYVPGGAEGAADK